MKNILIAILIIIYSGVICAQSVTAQKREAYSEGKEDERLTCSEFYATQGGKSIHRLRFSTSKYVLLFDANLLNTCSEKLKEEKYQPYNAPLVKEEIGSETALAKTQKLVCTFYISPQKKAQFAVVYPAHVPITSEEVKTCFQHPVVSDLIKKWESETKQEEGVVKPRPKSELKPKQPLPITKGLQST